MTGCENTLENLNVVQVDDGRGDGGDKCGAVVDKNGYTVVKEGSVEILFPSSADVFYNPVQQFNRDLSVLVVQVVADEHNQCQSSPNNNNDKNAACTASDIAVSPTPTPSGDVIAGGKQSAASKTQHNSSSKPCGGIRVLEALAASGLRSCRFAREVSGIGAVLACDLSAAAVRAMSLNVAHNHVADTVHVHHGDATVLMHSLKKDRYDVVDLDPYGSAAPFLDAAVQAVADGGVLQVTCTDMGVLCGVAPATCHAKYGATSIRSVFCHELALRILLQSIETTANRYGRHIAPLLSVSVDFYVRVFVRVMTSPATVRLSCTKISLAYLCSACHTWRLHPRCTVQWNGRNPKFSLPTGLPSGDKCPHCRSTVKVCGPIWSEAMHNATFVRQMLARLPSMNLGTSRRIEGVLSVIEEELPDVPLFYEIAKMANVLRMQNPPLNMIRSALLNDGHRVSSVHCSATAMKTDAPAARLWNVLRAWERLHPVRRDRLAENSAGAVLLATEAPSDVDFTHHKDANPVSRQKHLCRFQPNPEPNWGPKSRGKTSIHHNNLTEKRARNQGRRTQLKKSNHSCVGGHEHCQLSDSHQPTEGAAVDVSTNDSQMSPDEKRPRITEQHSPSSMS